MADRSTPQIARRVLLVHMLLLLAITAVVLLAARQIYQDARDQALDQATANQELLARQTTSGLEHFFQAIAADLALPDASADAQQQALTELVWSQVRGRALALAILDPADGGIQALYPDPAAAGLFTTPELLRWLATVQSTAVGGFERLDDGDVIFVVEPLTRGRLAVAAVPLSEVERLFLTQINQIPTASATLLDETGQILVTSDRSLIGQSILSNIHDAPAVAERFDRAGAIHTEVFDRRAQGGDGVERPSLLVTSKVVPLPGQIGYIVLTTQLSEVDRVVKTLFDSALLWSIFLVLAVTAVLASTASQVIRSRIRLDRARHDLLTRELRQARQIQLKWLPPEGTQTLRSLTVAAVNRPASHISGDFYNWFELPDGRIAVLIGDVTGHGMSAAFLMATTQLLLRTTLLRLGDPGKSLEHVNNQLCSQAFYGQFVTLLICVLDLDQRTLEVATAGHMPPILVQNGSTAPLPVEPQLMLGVEPRLTFPTERFELPGEAGLMLYTDGAPDAVAPDGERFGDEALLASLSRPLATADAMIHAVTEGIERFRGAHGLPDDLTLVALWTHPPS